MASIKLKHASGNSTILNSPASNPSADVTLKLPSTTGSAGQVLQVASANHSATNAELEFAAAAAGGKLVKVVQFTKTDTASFAVAAQNTYHYSSFAASITPSNASNKILVHLCLTVGMGGAQNALYLSILKAGANMFIGDSDGSRQRCASVNVINEQYFAETASLVYLDTAGGTSSITYSLEIAQSSSSQRTVFINRSDSDGNNAEIARGASTLTLMEIEP